MIIVSIEQTGNTISVLLDNNRAYNFEASKIEDSDHLKQLIEDCLTAEKNAEQEQATKVQSCRDDLLDTEVSAK